MFNALKVRVILLAIFGIFGAAALGTRMLAQPGGAPSASGSRGQQMYDTHCAECHGTEGKGDGKLAPKDTHPADLTDAKWERGSTDGEIFAVIQNGAGPKFDMKGYKAKMSETDIWNVVNYVRSLGPKNTK